MALELYMVGLIVQDMGKSLEFYRQLGLAIPEDSNGQSQMVQIKMKSGVTLFLNTGGGNVQKHVAATGNNNVVLEFYLTSRTEVEAKYQKLTEAGYQSFRAPYVTSFGMYFAMITDPDGNVVLLSAS
jgi:predicted lactoylglutathione lyase